MMDAAALQLGPGICSKRIKIALILPRAGLYRYGSGGFPKWLRYAPLTLTTLAALVPAELNAEVTIYDEGVEQVDKARITADLVGITSITGASKRAYGYADYFRSRGTTVIIGGVHATLLPDEAKQHADAVVTGQAYRTWPQALWDFRCGCLKPFYRSAARIDFAAVPTAAAREKLRRQGYFTVNSIQAVYGCPNACEFCVTPYVCRGYQHRPIADVVREVAGLGGRYFSFVDPSPIENVRYAKNLCRALVPLKKKWTGLATTRLMQHPELMDLMAESGCRALLIGFESLSPQSNLQIAKGFNDVDGYRRFVSALHERGIAVMGCFVHGLDEDDRDCFKRTLDFVLNSNIDLPRFTVPCPFPGTKYFDRLKSEGRILTEDWSFYDAQHVVFTPRQMSVAELEYGHHWIWREAYRLGSIGRRLWGARCFLEAAILTNLSYRRYARMLPIFGCERMLQDTV